MYKKKHIAEKKKYKTKKDYATSFNGELSLCNL